MTPGDVASAVQSAGPSRAAPEQEDMYIDVPPGTVVRRKRSRELFGDLTKHGQTLLLAAGGEGGMAAGPGIGACWMLPPSDSLLIVHQYTCLRLDCANGSAVTEPLKTSSLRTSKLRKLS